jgi:hypothetical protein
MNALRYRFLVPAVLTAVAFAMTGCGLTSSPADNLTFKAPDTWSASPGIMGFMQFWTSPSTPKQVLMLFRSPKPIDEHQAFSSANMKNAKVEFDQQITICKTQPAHFVKATATSTKDGHDETMQLIVTDLNGTSYMAMYIYPATAQPDSAAADAIRELCAKPA